MFRTTKEAREHFKIPKANLAKIRRHLDKLIPDLSAKEDQLCAVTLLSHQELIWKIRTTEVAAVLGISRAKAYALCCEAERLGVLTGWQTSADYSEQFRHLEPCPYDWEGAKRFSREAIVWEVWIKRRGKEDLDGYSEVGELHEAIRAKIKKGLANATKSNARK